MKYFINLSAGLLQNKYKGEIIRIQSSHLETHSFDRLFYGLSDSLLYNLAKEEECIIVDCSSNHTGKVIRRGIPIIKMVLSRRWHEDRNHYELGREYADRILRSLSRQTKNKIDFYKKFLHTGKRILLSGISIKVNKEKEVNK
jgi:hypothetical protein